jgi:hypothetical protein
VIGTRTPCVLRYGYNLYAGAQVIQCLHGGFSAGSGNEDLFDAKLPRSLCRDLQNIVCIFSPRFFKIAAWYVVWHLFTSRPAF